MLTSDEQKAHLREQLEFLANSAAAYDSGAKHEAKRIAAVIRTLLHDTPKSHALLGQIGAQNVTLMTTVEPLPPPRPNPDGTQTYAVRVNSPFGVVKTSDSGVELVPLCAAPRPCYQAFIPVIDWWNEIVWNRPVKMTRRELVLSAANTDGGSHVDPKGTASHYGGGYGAVKAGAGAIVVIRDGSETPIGNPQYVDLRQLAHELLSSPDLQALAA